MVALALLTAACSGSKAPAPGATDPSVEGSIISPTGAATAPGKNSKRNGGNAVGTNTNTNTGSNGGGPTGDINDSGGVTGTGKYVAPPGVDKDTIKLGFIYPAGGPYAVLTANIEPAVKAGMQAINDAGGIHGRKLEFVKCDDGYNNASVALGCATSLKDQVFGWSTIALLAGTVIAPFSDEHGIPMIVGNIDRATTLKMKYVFPGSTFLEDQAEMLPAFIVNRLNKPGAKVGIIYQATPQIAVIREHFTKYAAEHGLKVVKEQSIEESPSSCVNEVQNLQSTAAEVAILLTSPVPAIRCLLDAKTIGYEPTWTGVGPTFNLNITNTGSAGATEGITMLSNFHTLDTAAGKRYQRQVEKYYPDDDDAPDDDLAFLAWGQLNMWAEGLRRSDTQLTRPGFVSALETFKDWDGGVFAPSTFGPGDREPSRRAIVVKCVSQRWTTIDATWRTHY